jgi:LAO/AO transport system kinase
VQAGPEGPSPLAERLLAGDKRALARARHRAAIAEAGDLAERRRRNLLNEVLALVTARLRAAVAAGMRDDPEVQELLDSVVARRLDPASAARAILTRRPAADLSFADTSPQFADRL